MLTLLFDRTETDTELIRFSSPLLVVLSCKGNEVVVVESWIGDELESWIGEGSMGEGLGMGEAAGRFSIIGTPLMSTTTEFVASVDEEGTRVPVSEKNNKYTLEPLTLYWVFMYIRWLEEGK